jgi:AcrR family transcriptional regulator
MDDIGTTRPKRPLRADAARNADRVIAAALRAGVGAGVNVPRSQIAAAAGVGETTLHRRYPRREDLLEALRVHAYRILILDAEEALELGASGLDAIGRYLRQTFKHRDELMVQLHSVPSSELAESALLRDRLKGLMAAMLDRGHTDGSVRSEVTPLTVLRFGAMLAQPTTGIEGWAETATEQRTVFMRGIAADPS